MLSGSNVSKQTVALAEELWKQEVHLETNCGTRKDMCQAFKFVIAPLYVACWMQMKPFLSPVSLQAHLGQAIVQLVPFLPFPVAKEVDWEYNLSDVDVQARDFDANPIPSTLQAFVCLWWLLTHSLVSMGLIISVCKREKHGTMAYNCREAEQVYSQQLLKKPPKPIEKADICIVPVIRQEDAKQPQAEVEALPESVWTDCLGKTCHMTPTLYRTLRNQQNQISFVDQSERFAVPTMHVQHRPFSALKTGNPCAQDVWPTSQKSYSVSRSKGPLSEIAPQHQGRPVPKASPEEAHSHRHILRSLVRLSMAALAEQGSGRQLSIESAPVQQISQLLSLLHQGQVQPKPNHKGNKYTAKHVCCRSPHPNVEDLITKEDNENRHHDLDLLGEEFGNLIDCPPGLGMDQQTEADPAWMGRLSIPLSLDYKDNVVSPGTLLFPVSQETRNRDEPHTFETFGKANGCKLNTAEPGLASTFLSEMGTLFEMILAQNPRPQMDSSLDFLQQVSICSQTRDLDGDVLGSKTNRALSHRTF
ncbi:hypothetical protein JD844_017161 [Phrynosoma platyrhinos]|uniref:Uncharacterized protein n=1 Tax=Phrynosoma platyrhinos TaxID=52577 RepID=A0ABQ7SLH4_PHRPL|nr:hypothetical protein JD844_017161 [Phrynosoma platyrhinos]